MTVRILLIAVLALAACATPQQRCINGVTRDLRVVTGLIAETEANLARGYGLEEQVVYRTVWVPCRDRIVVTTDDGQRVVRDSGRMCLDDRPETVRRPVAIDLAAERRKLDQLRVQQTTLNRQAAPAVEQCRVLNPE
jgi:hypothetical protein